MQQTRSIFIRLTVSSANVRWWSLYLLVCRVPRATEMTLKLNVVFPQEGLTAGIHLAQCHTLRYLLTTYAARYILCHETSLLVTECLCTSIVDLKWQFYSWFT